MRIRPALLTLSLLLAAPLARADEYDQAARDVARTYAEEGIAAHDHGDYSAAVQSFTKAYRVLGAPTIGVRLARSLVKLGRLVEASKMYQIVLATPVKKGDPPVFTQSINEAKAELAALTPRIPLLEITVAPGVTSPLLDGHAISPSTLGQPTPVDPGPHRISGEGATPELLVLSEGERAKAALQAEAPSASTKAAGAEPNWRRIAGISGVGLGGVSLLVGVIGTLMANSVRNNDSFEAYRRSHPTSKNVCVGAEADFSFDIADLCSKASTGEVLQFVFYPAAVLLGGAGTYLMMTSPKGLFSPAAQVQLAPQIGLHTAGVSLTGTF